MLERLGFDKHHKIERFAVILAIILVLLLVDCGFALQHSVLANQETLSAQAIYTEDSTTSLTNQDVKVINIYRNEQDTKVFVLLEWPDVTAISTDAENYQMYLTGSNSSGTQQNLESSPHGAIYMFGNTGYMGIYLINAEPFPTQIVNLVIRNNAIVTSTSDVSDEDREEMEDQSFADYDQFRIYFNPGGTEAKIADFLNQDSFTVAEAYEEMVLRDQEAELKETLNTELKEMQTDLAQIDEYASRLSRDGIQIPSEPIQIKNDVVEKNEETGLYELKTDYVINGGLNFDWQDGSIAEGYLEKITDDPYEYLSELELEDNYDPMTTSDITWYYTDGREFDQSSVSTDISGNAQRINTDIELLIHAWEAYYNEKFTYQTSTLKELLYLDYSALTAGDNYTINANEDALIIYGY